MLGFHSWLYVLRALTDAYECSYLYSIIQNGSPVFKQSSVLHLVILAHSQLWQPLTSSNSLHSIAFSRISCSYNHTACSLERLALLYLVESVCFFHVLL